VEPDRLETATRRLVMAGLGALAVTGPASAGPLTSSASALNQEADAALARLYAASPKARELAARSRAVLIFPKIIKAGFMIGGQTGDGVMRIHGRPVGYFNTSAASFGMQAGAQTFSYALFFITQSSLDFLARSNGWQIGTGPSVVLIDKGLARTLNTTTLTQDVYAMIFGQKGLMGGLGIEGSKITRIQPGP
jgi:lipid-binding SYLF domain-containing protein